MNDVQLENPFFHKKDHFNHLLWGRNGSNQAPPTPCLVALPLYDTVPTCYTLHGKFVYLYPFLLFVLIKFNEWCSIRHTINHFFTKKIDTTGCCAKAWFEPGSSIILCGRHTTTRHCNHCCIFLWKFVYLYPDSLFVLIKWCTTRTYTIPFFFRKIDTKL